MITARNGLKSPYSWDFLQYESSIEDVIEFLGFEKVTTIDEQLYVKSYAGFVKVSRTNYILKNRDGVIVVASAETVKELLNKE